MNGGMMLFLVALVAMGGFATGRATGAGQAEPKTDAQKDREHRREVEIIHARAEAYAKAKCRP
jgi:hypothetical protein